MHRLLVTLAIVVMVATLAPAAAAGETVDTVTLEAGKNVMKYGQWVRLEGRVKPALGGQLVTIVDRKDGSIAETTTDEEGRYSLLIQPPKNLKLRARTLTAKSEFVPIKVAFRVNVSLRDVALFGNARVAGSIAPAQPGESALVRLFRNGKLAQKKQVKLKEGRSFKSRMDIRKPGRYKAKLSYDSADLKRGADQSRSRTTKLPSLSTGSKGAAVRRLEKRLRQLGYYLPGADKSFGYSTRDALIAFNKIQRRARTGSVTESTWRALASPKRPKPRATSPRKHIEIDQTRQVIMFVRKGKVKWILHTSTGRNGYTHDGVYRVNRKIAGYSGGRLYYPSYFDGLRAIHGWPEVPTYPASAGCARIPMWSAQWAHKKAPMGMQVRVYH
ncbi:MAG: peptidoglycan-binding protein [Actinomycetota bacterium]